MSWLSALCLFNVCSQAGRPLLGLDSKCGSGTKGEHVDLLRCAGQSLTFQRQQQRQQQTERPQGAVSHDSGLRTHKQPVQSGNRAVK